MINTLACNGVIQTNPLSCDGTWVSIASSTFDVSTLSPLLLAEAFGAGFSIFGAISLVVFSLKLFLKPFFR